MTVRFHRQRLLILSIIFIIGNFYLINYYLKKDSIVLNEEKKEFSTKVAIDWHDYQAILRENNRTGLGESGLAVEVSSKEKNSLEFAQLYQKNGFNAFISDKISLDRSLRDIRHPECQTKLYLANLPSVSIIIPIHDEHLNTLLRSIHSILNRTPEKLLREIILVDDASSQTNLQSTLDRYISNLNKTRIIRLKKREGLIRTRLTGARIAKGDILIFFDSHVEVNINWLPPLIEPIALNYRTSVCPFIDIIKWDTFAYIAQDEGARGAFDWSMFYKRLPLLPSQMEHPTEPFDNPVMAGGLFAIDKKWFWELGGYDEGLDIWGGEQYEMSFKIWQCGGRLVDAPCSRVGHIYRQFNPHSGKGFGDYITRNHKRVATVWMDEYAEYIYKRNPHMRLTNPGSVKKQIALREKLQCKSFKWYMENIAFDIPRHYPPIPIPPFAEGEIRSLAAPFCIDTKHGDAQTRIGLDICQSDQSGHTGEQNFEITWRQDIRPKDRNLCFDVPQRGLHPPIILFHCHNSRGNQHFVYDFRYFHLLHIASKLCLDCNLDTKTLFMSQCDPQRRTQQWNFFSYNQTLIEQEMEKFFLLTKDELN